jgi:hypothetical protein
LAYFLPGNELERCGLNLGIAALQRGQQGGIVSHLAMPREAGQQLDEQPRLRDKPVLMRRLRREHLPQVGLGLERVDAGQSFGRRGAQARGKAGVVDHLHQLGRMGTALEARQADSRSRADQGVW